MKAGNEKIQPDKKSFRFADHPWISLIVFVFFSILSIVLTIIVYFGIFDLPRDSKAVYFVQSMSYHILTLFVIVPFILHLPRGKRTFREYLDDIRLSNFSPFTRLLALSLSCYLILALCQGTGSMVYRFFEREPVNWTFVMSVFDFSGDFPPGSPSLWVSFPSIFEEVAFRGVVLTMFLNKYSKRKSILFSAAAFGLMHLLSLSSGYEVVWVMGQVGWSFILGIFYGYLFIKADSLWPPMIVHYLGNVFIGSFTAYIQSMASIETQVLYGLIFTLGIVPTTLMIIWVRFFSKRWLLTDKVEPGAVV
jgi:membrane protease YdiL (CAAX protease family)